MIERFGGCYYGCVFVRCITKGKINITTKDISHTYFYYAQDGGLICVVL